MEIFKSMRFRITEGLLNNDNFIASRDSGIIRINKKLSDDNFNQYFKCIIMCPGYKKQEIFLVDEFVYNNYTNKFALLNNGKIGSHVTHTGLVVPSSVMSLYSFDDDTILIVIDDKEMNIEYDFTRQ